jgi:hypothetical protein
MKPRFWRLNNKNMPIAANSPTINRADDAGSGTDAAAILVRQTRLIGVPTDTLIPADGD